VTRSPVVAGAGNFRRRHVGLLHDSGSRSSPAARPRRRNRKRVGRPRRVRRQRHCDQVRGLPGGGELPSLRRIVLTSRRPAGSRPEAPGPARTAGPVWRPCFRGPRLPGHAREPKVSQRRGQLVEPVAEAGHTPLFAASLQPGVLQGRAAPAAARLADTGARREHRDGASPSSPTGPAPARRPWEKGVGSTGTAELPGPPPHNPASRTARLGQPRPPQEDHAPPPAQPRCARERRDTPSPGDIPPASPPPRPVPGSALAARGSASKARFGPRRAGTQPGHPGRGQRMVPNATP